MCPGGDIFEDDTNRPHAVSFSGGKDSTYLLLEMIRRGMPIDLVLNADTGMEFPAMYEHIDKVERFLLAERGIPITRLKASRTFEELMLDAVRIKSPERATGYGWPNAVVRWCTGQLKTHLLHQYTAQFPLKPYEYVAIAADEQYRLVRETNQGELRRHPLVDWNVTEAQALAGCYEAGYDWGGLYKHFSRVSCWCCPLQSLDELRALHTFYPEVWAMLRELDDKAVAHFGRDNPYGQFRKSESVRMLEFRFAFEKSWGAIHGEIRSRAFFQALKRLYAEHFYVNGRYFADPPNPESGAWTKKQRVAELLPFVMAEDLTEPLDAASPTPKKKRRRRANPAR